MTTTTTSTPREASTEDLERWRTAAQDRTLCIVEGELAVTRACRSGWTVRGVVATAARWERLAPVLPAGVDALRADHAALREIAGYDFHRGCLAWVERQPPECEIPQRGSLRVVAALGLSDPANLGALMRNARAFGVDALWIDRGGADPLSRRAIRASAGWVFDLPWRLVDGGAEVIMRAAHATAALIATTPDASAVSLRGFAAPERAVVCFGSEGPGLDERLLGVASIRLRVELDAAIDSLNVAASSAVVLHAIAPR
jgi:tRNA G18 (ribose-2'-O)-methylase SpoU